MFSEPGTTSNSHDFVNDFVEFPLHGEPLDFEQHHFEENNQPAHEQYPDKDNVSLHELFYSPMLTAAPGSTEPTPLMTPSDQSFAMPPSYFSPSLSPGLSGGAKGEMPDFELPKKAVATPNGGRVSKQKSVRRKWAATGAPSSSRNNSVSQSSRGRHSSTTSPSDDNEPDTHKPSDTSISGGANSGNVGSSTITPTGAVTPLSLMNGSTMAADIPQNTEVEFRLNEALLATQSQMEAPKQRRFSGNSNSSQSHTPAIRARNRGMQQSSTNSSPAIAPYLSPAIAPNDVDALLASKSNYQNIIDGKHQQLGLQYPERLAADITSKKASHKVAEQERRNRINVAITELGRLVTPDAPMTSKAATVEAAIDYIRGLHAEINDLRQRLDG